MVVRAYLRASTEDQNAERARSALEAFAAERGLAIASTDVENESGGEARPAGALPAAEGLPQVWRRSSLSRPRLSRLTSGERYQEPAGEREAQRHRHYAGKGGVVVSQVQAATGCSLATIATIAKIAKRRTVVA